VQKFAEYFIDFHGTRLRHLHFCLFFTLPAPLLYLLNFHLLGNFFFPLHVFFFFLITEHDSFSGPDSPYQRNDHVGEKTNKQIFSMPRKQVKGCVMEGWTRYAMGSWIAPIAIV